MNGFTAPVGDSKRIDNVELISSGMQLCTLYSLVDVGTQDAGNYGPKHRVRLAFEFPQHMRVFYEGDPPKPSAIFISETLSMGNGSNLREKWVEPMIGRKLTDDQAKVFDISSLLGKHFVATIAHSPDGKWANIMAITALDANNCKLFGLTEPRVQQINPTIFYHLTQGFDTDAFANLPKKLRDIIIGSEEGRKHKASGGIFKEPADNGGYSPAPPSGGSGLVWLSNQFTYEQLKNGGWSDDQMIAQGYAKRAEAVPPPTPVQSAPTPPPPGGAPTPPAEKKLVFTDPNAQPLEVWLQSGWTVEKIVAEGHATFQ